MISTGFLSVIIIWELLQSWTCWNCCTKWLLSNVLQHVWVQSSNTDLCSSGTAAGATDLFGLTQLYHEVRWASVGPHHSRMEKTVHKLWGGTLKCAQPVCVCAEVLCLLLNTILFNLNCTIYILVDKMVRLKSEITHPGFGKNCVVCDVCHTPVYISHFDGFTLSLFWMLNFLYV